LKKKSKLLPNKYIIIAPIIWGGLLPNGHEVIALAMKELRQLDSSDGGNHSLQKIKIKIIYKKRIKK